jgi:GNAT superfamily N-acetyltransferase
MRETPYGAVTVGPNPRNANEYRSTLRRVTAAEVHDALMIIREAAAWAAARDLDVWSERELRYDLYLEAARRSELVIGYADAVPVATMLLQSEDPIYWPEAAPGSALYVHKVAVRRAYAGQSWLTRMFGFAVAEAAGAAIPALRLDTLLRPKLQAMYEGEGFTRLAEPPLVVGGKQMIRMQRILEPRPAVGH